MGRVEQAPFAARTELHRPERPTHSGRLVVSPVCHAVDVFVSGGEDRGLAVYPAMELPDAAAASCRRSIENGTYTGTLS